MRVVNLKADDAKRNYSFKIRVGCLVIGWECVICIFLVCKLRWAISGSGTLETQLSLFLHCVSVPNVQQPCFSLSLIAHQHIWFYIFSKLSFRVEKHSLDLFDKRKD